MKTGAFWLACEQALLFGRANRAAWEHASVPRLRVSSRASTFQEIPQIENLLAGYNLMSQTFVIKFTGDFEITVFFNNIFSKNIKAEFSTKILSLF